MNKKITSNEYKNFLSEDPKHFINIDKMFFKFLLDCLLAQRNVYKLDFEEKEKLQKAIDNAYHDGMCMINNKNFIPKSEVLTTQTINTIAKRYLSNKWAELTNKLKVKGR